MGETNGTPEPGDDAAKPPRRRLVVLALAVVVSLVAWGALVYAAIDFGGEARSGEGIAWVYVGITTIAATACLVAALLLGARLLALLRGDPGPERHQGGHRRTRS